MRFVKAILTFVVVSIIIIAGCYYFGNKTEKSENDIDEKGNGGPYQTEPEFTVENYPRVDGSTSAHPLGVIVACKLLNISY
ncbi:hypothetical protein, partial [[Eubacterium] cellulosolvens]